MRAEDKSRLDVFMNGLSQFSDDPLVLDEVIPERVWLLIRMDDSHGTVIAKIVYLEEKAEKRFRLLSLNE